jgi:hypothetical protein
MLMDLRSWIRSRHATYEVSPCFREVEDTDGGVVRTSRKVLAGFDVDVFGVDPENDRLAAPPAHEYACGHAALQRLAAEVAHEAGHACSLDVVVFPGRIVVDSRGGGKVKAMLRISISHFGPLDQPAGLAEHQALELVRQRLDALGITRR